MSAGRRQHRARGRREAAFGADWHVARFNEGMRRADRRYRARMKVKTMARHIGRMKTRGQLDSRGSVAAWQLFGMQMKVSLASRQARYEQVSE